MLRPILIICVVFLAACTPSPTATAPAPGETVSIPSPSAAVATFTPMPPATATPLEPTATAPPPTATAIPPTATALPPTATPAPPTATSTPALRGVVLPPTSPPQGRIRSVVVDPGHGGPETGSAPAADLVEKDLNLRISLALAAMLRDDGFQVVLTRDDDAPVAPAYRDSGVRSQVVQDLQARVDIANAADADLFLSIHNNGSGDPAARGTEVWFNAARPFADRNLALAELVLENLVGRLRQAGHPAANRGIKDDANFRIWNGRVFNLYVLGPGQGSRPSTRMPGVLGESLFLTNPGDAAALRRPAIHQAIARGYRDAVLQYVERFPNRLEG